MKSLFYGIGLATLSGLMLGGALRPEIVMDRIGGPQIALGDTGRVAYGDYDGGTTHYPNGAPDYVIGTDHLYAQAAYEPQIAPEIAYEPEPAYAEADWRGASSDLPAVEPASYNPEPTPTYDAVVRYPSQGGGILAGLDAAPVNLGPEVIEPADAPPAAMAAFQSGMGG